MQQHISEPQILQPILSLITKENNLTHLIPNIFYNTQDTPMIMEL